MYKLSLFIVALALFTSCGKKENATEDFSRGEATTETASDPSSYDPNKSFANTSYGHRFNFYKVRKNMTKIIRLILIEGLYLHREKDSIPISVVYVAKTGTSGYRLRR